MPELTRRQIALVVGAAVAVLALVVGTLGILTGPTDDGTDAQTGAIDTDSDNALRIADHDPTTSALPRTDDPAAYARAIAIALFEWDSDAGYLPADYQAPVLADADPDGEEAPGLISDVSTYFPSVDQWLDLATMDVTQSLTIDTAKVPTSWPSVLEEAHGQLRPGTTAITITGTRERTGLWNGTRATASSPLAFTVFVACPPAFNRCHVLRLSALDNPLR